MCAAVLPLLPHEQVSAQAAAAKSSRRTSKRTSTSSMATSVTTSAATSVLHMRTSNTGPVIGPSSSLTRGCYTGTAAAAGHKHADSSSHRECVPEAAPVDVVARRTGTAACTVTPTHSSSGSTDDSSTLHTVMYKSYKKLQGTSMRRDEKIACQQVLAVFQVCL